MKIYVANNVNIDDFCKGWEEICNGYRITSSCSDEYCYIDKSTREVEHDGYIGMITDYINQGKFIIGTRENELFSYSPGEMYYLSYTTPSYGPLCINSFSIITICGSSRFKEEILKARERLTLEGYIVLSPDVFSHYDNIELTEDQKNMLISMHKSKIYLANTIYVVNKDGYIGEGLKEEIEYAESLNKNIIYMED